MSKRKNPTLDAASARLDETLAELKARLDTQAERFTTPRYPAAQAFAAARVQPKDGRRWLDRGIITPAIVGKGRGKFQFSLKDVLTLAIMGRLVDLGFPPATAEVVGERTSRQMVSSMGRVFAFASMEGSFMRMHVARDANSFHMAGTSSLQPDLPADFPPVHVVIDVLPLAREVFAALGVMFISGTSDDLRAVAEGMDQASAKKSPPG